MPTSVAEWSNKEVANKATKGTGCVTRGYFSLRHYSASGYETQLTTSNLESTTSLVTLLDTIKQEEGMEVRTDATLCTPVECFTPSLPPSYTPTAESVGLYKQLAAMW
uniref:Uncharacterized protein n=1 Tax=Timema tahoe TaxID=61484 RepID=A0A7R9FMW9_9NEOP|nr:unnamed protein product [Timema tahoe]